MHRTSKAIGILVTVALAAGVMAAPSSAASADISLKRVLSGYSRPVLVTHAPGGGRTIFIVEQTGKIKRATYANGRWRKLGVFLDVTNLVVNPNRSGNGERGLLGLAFHPEYRDNGRFYVDYTRKGSGSKKGDTVIAEFRRSSAGKADKGSKRTLMVIDQPAPNHNGGHLAFGPDELLYVAMGDGGGSGDPNGNGQKLSTRHGALLRIDPLDPDGAGPKRYRIPAGNPRVGKAGQNSLWAWGLRNPWRFSFDRANGDLWIGDVGQGDREEVNRSRSNAAGIAAGKGRNYGWNRCEGKRRYPNTGASCTFGTRPVHDYAHGAGRCSVTGGYVHRGPGAPTWRGLYVGGDFCGRLFVLNGKGMVKLSRTTNRRIASFGEDAAGRIFATDLSNGSIYRVRMTGPRP
ncbi:MAG: PQQ-dependent sugar dehydrogenase [Candidatus Limnocylindrales bacterium]